MTTLLMSSRHTADDQALWRVAIGRGWRVVRARGLRVPPIDEDDLVIYLEALYAGQIASRLGCTLLSPTEDWLPQLSRRFTRRDIELSTLGRARELTVPRFVKPPNDKSFAARVYSSGADLPAEFDATTPVLIAEPVTWRVEFRCFCLDDQVRTLSPYLRDGEHAGEQNYSASEGERKAARDFAEEVLSATSAGTPRAIVIDVGLLANETWAVVEGNAAWGSGIYGCNPEAVLDVVRESTSRRA